MKVQLKWENLRPGVNYGVKFNKLSGVVTCFVKDYTKPITQDNIEAEIIVPDNLGRDFIIRFEKESSKLFDNFNLTMEV